VFQPIAEGRSIEDRRAARPVIDTARSGNSCLQPRASRRSDQPLRTPLEMACEQPGRWPSWDRDRVIQWRCLVPQRAGQKGHPGGHKVLSYACHSCGYEGENRLRSWELEDVVT
jgi:hypothetical protein